MEIVKINNEEVMFFGNPQGHFKSNNRIASKFNRVTKLAIDYNQLYSKLISFVKNDTKAKRKNLAYACLLMINSGIRVGNESSAEGYTTKIKELEGQFVQTYGLTTLKHEHVTFENVVDVDDDLTVYDSFMYLDFIGKKSVKQSICIIDPFLIKWGKYFYDLNVGKETWLNITNYEITKFVHKYIGSKFVPKDLRSLKANIEAFKIHKNILATKLMPSNKKEAKQEVKEIVEKTSEYLGNTPAICKKAYVDPKLLEYHLNMRYQK